MAQGGGYQLSQAPGSLQKCPFNTTLLEAHLVICVAKGKLDL